MSLAGADWLKNQTMEFQGSHLPFVTRRISTNQNAGVTFLPGGVFGVFYLQQSEKCRISQFLISAFVLTIMSAELPWHAAYPAPRGAAPSISREELLQWIREGKQAGKDFLLVDLRRTDYEVWVVRNKK